MGVLDGLVHQECCFAFNSNGYTFFLYTFFVIKTVKKNKLKNLNEILVLEDFSKDKKKT